MTNSVDREWAIGLTQEEYDYLINVLHSFGVGDDVRGKLEACRSSAIIHGVFSTDKKSA